MARKPLIPRVGTRDSGYSFNDLMNLSKVVLAGILFIGYYVIMVIALFIGVPAGSENIVLQGIAMIGPVIGAVASNMFPKNEDRTRTDSDTISTLADKVPPPTVPPENLSTPRETTDD